jgi:nitrous oxide reductase
MARTGSAQAEAARLRRRRRLTATAIRAASVCVALACAFVAKSSSSSGRRAALSVPASLGSRGLLQQEEEQHVDRRWEAVPSFEELTNIPVLDDEVDKCGSIINDQRVCHARQLISPL